MHIVWILILLQCAWSWTQLEWNIVEGPDHLLNPRSANSLTSHAKKRAQPHSDDDFTDTPSHHSQGVTSYVHHSIKIKFLWKTVVSCSGLRERSHPTIHLPTSLWQWFWVLCRRWGRAFSGLANFCSFKYVGSSNDYSFSLLLVWF